MRLRATSWLLFALIAVVMVGVARTPVYADDGKDAGPDANVTAELRQEALDVLREQLGKGRGPTAERAARYLIILDYQTSVPQELRDRLSASLESEKDSAKATAASTAAAGNPSKPALDDLRRGAKAAAAKERLAATEGLATRAANDDTPLLKTLMRDSDPDVRAAAAYATLRLQRRAPHCLSSWDWLVIAVYAAGMLWLGWFYSRRTKTTEAYLLGGRNMQWLAVGLSLFAAMLSTLSYLAYPGEVAKNGPMYLSMFFAYPLIAIVVGWFVIPRIMRQRVTSAYEILEKRLGLGSRMVAAALFLSMRLLWMALIIYATSSTILVPVMGLEPSSTFTVCIVLGGIAVIYAAMGGLPGVVVAGAIKCVVLYGAVLGTLVVISVEMGGVGAWWPTHWPSYWPEPTWGWDLSARMSTVGIMINALVWWVATLGSDQMAIQRYLATRDAPAARKVLFTSLLCDVTVGGFLGALGVALVAYFFQHPHLMPDGMRVLDNADQLLPRFFMLGFPAGVSGLVIAVLMATAMISLCSGVNSACSVISVDFIDRFRTRNGPVSETNHVKVARYVSIFIGIAVVALSLLVSLVHGNLLELCYKVINLITAPMFGLFFMALYIRRATEFGALVGAAFGLVTVVLLSFWDTITGTHGISFIWAIPIGFLVQVAVGIVASWLRGTPRPMLE